VKPNEGHVSRGVHVFYDSADGIFVPPEKRNVGCVFQQHRLFSHMSVKNNLLFAPRFCGKCFDGETFEKVVTLLGISHLLKRRPNTLSGGESQRVAIGRAILSCSSLLLMDEPVSSLDRARKEEIFEYITMIPKQFGTPVIYVTHSVEELTALADAVLVIENGSAGNLMGRDEFTSNYLESRRKEYAKNGGENIR
jgi:molybdate transport system ATP-binding protein